MGLSQQTTNAVWGRSGGRCYLDRSEELSRSESGNLPIGQIAHIVGEKPSGPRGDAALPIEDRNKVDNLLLLCPNHHTEIDKHPEIWTVERLTRIKEDHEEWVRQSLDNRTTLIWNVPHIRNPNFTGRNILITKLRKLLTSKKSTTLTQAIHGLGGVGKTQLALEYAYRCITDYDIIWWIHAENPTSIIENYIDIANALDLPEKINTNINIIIKAVRQWLSNNQKWLLIFDNAIQPEDIHDYLPFKTEGHVIITSRNPNWLDIASLLAVNVFEREESVKFLCKRTGQTDIISAELLAETLGDLPLALAQAGSYIEITGMSIADYLNLFKKYQSELLTRGKPSNDYTETVATTWEISFDIINEKSSEAIQILNICSYLAPDNIPKEIFISPKPGILSLRIPSPRTEFEPLAFDDAMILLRKYSLINIKNDILSTHRLIQTVVRNKLAVEEQKQWAADAYKLIKDFFTHSHDVNNWSKCILLLPHAQAIVSHLENLNIISDISDDISYLLNSMGSFLHRRGIFISAENYFQKSLEIIKNKFGENNFQITETLQKLALLFQDQKKYNKAEQLARQALEITKSNWIEDYKRIATDSTVLAQILIDQDKYAEAERLINYALKIFEKEYGEKDRRVTIVLSTISYMHKCQGNYDEAEQLFSRVLKIFESSDNKDDLDIARTLVNLAQIYNMQDKFIKAEKYSHRALKIFKLNIAKEHPDVASTLEALADSLLGQGIYDKAEEIRRKSEKIRDIYK